MTGPDADIVVRMARNDDLAQLLALYALLSDSDADRTVTRAHRRAFDAVLADRRQCLLIADQAGLVAGCVTLIVVPNLTHGGRPYGIIEGVVVREDVRRRGVGSLLMQTAARVARDVGCYRVALTSRVDNTEAHAFYERLGFVTTQRSFRLDLESGEEAGAGSR